MSLILGHLLHNMISWCTLALLFLLTTKLEASSIFIGEEECGNLTHPYQFGIGKGSCSDEKRLNISAQQDSLIGLARIAHLGAIVAPHKSRQLIFPNSLTIDPHRKLEYQRTKGSGYKPHIKVFPAKITLGLGLCFCCLIVLFGITGVYSSVKRKKIIKLKSNFFQTNGGLLLEQHIASHASTRIFRAEEIEMATEDYKGSCGFGPGESRTIYKGRLPDGVMVLIKKRVVEQGQVERFINEIITLTQINHQHVVKFLGCCLETEVPFLVYELASNGTLSDYIHHTNGKSSLSWDILLKIASESAATLAYLHSATNSSKPMIIHGNVKSSNILLTDCFKAKVCGFGPSSSRLVPIKESQISTLVQRTLGYLDPEYLLIS